MSKKLNIDVVCVSLILCCEFGIFSIFYEFLGYFIDFYIYLIREREHDRYHGYDPCRKLEMWITPATNQELLEALSERWVFRGTLCHQSAT